jgi:hypothetical protein
MKPLARMEGASGLSARRRAMLAVCAVALLLVMAQLALDQRPLQRAAGHPARAREPARASAGRAVLSKRLQPGHRLWSGLEAVRTRPVSASRRRAIETVGVVGAPPAGAPVARPAASADLEVAELVAERGGATGEDGTRRT